MFSLSPTGPRAEIMKMDFFHYFFQNKGIFIYWNPNFQNIKTIFIFENLVKIQILRTPQGPNSESGHIFPTRYFITHRDLYMYQVSLKTKADT